MLQALSDAYPIDLLTWREVELDSVNRHFGTDLRREHFGRVETPRAAHVLDLAPTPAAQLKIAILLRHARRRADRYDLLMGAHNEADFGRPGIQYVHFPWNFRPRPAVDQRWYHVPALTRLYFRAVDLVAPFDADRVRRNLTLVNSDWTAARVREIYPGIATTTLHPPVAGSFPAVPWSEREDGAAIVGRISGEKRVDVAIEIVRRLRERGRPLRLHVIGPADDRRAYAKVQSLARRHHHWLRLHHDLSRPELCALLSRLRYGLHAMENEHYGMAVAEMVAAGMIPFAHQSGGPREILEDVPGVLWRTTDDAVDRIEAVVSDPERQERILSTLAARRATLSTTHFENRVREEVAAFLRRAPVEPDR